MKPKNLVGRTRPFVLLVEDDQDDQELFLEVLNQINPGHNVHMLSDGEELFDFLQKIKMPESLPTLIILDYNLPRLGGEATLVLLKKASLQKYPSSTIFHVYDRSKRNRPVVNGRKLLSEKAPDDGWYQSAGKGVD